MSPEISVVMPAYNAGELILAAVQSVWRQTHERWELVIVDDHSKDRTLATASDLARHDSRIRVISNSTNMGVARSRNIALEHARGDLVAFLDSDDLWHPSKLEKQLDFMRKSGSAITFGDYMRVSWDGRPLKRVRSPESTDYRQMLRSNFIGNLTAIYDRKRLPELRFDHVGNEDHLFWLNALRRLDEPVFSTPSEEPLASYRVSPGSLSGNKLRSAIWQWQIYRNHLQQGFLQSSIYMSFYAYHGVQKRWTFNGDLS